MWLVWMVYVMVVLFYGVRWIVNFNEWEILYKWIYRELLGLIFECFMLFLFRYFGKMKDLFIWYFLLLLLVFENIKINGVIGVDF